MDSAVESVREVTVSWIAFWVNHISKLAAAFPQTAASLAVLVATRSGSDHVSHDVASLSPAIKPSIPTTSGFREIASAMRRRV